MAPSCDRDAWVRDEPRWGEVGLRVVSRGRRQPFLVLAAALLTTGLYVTHRALKPATYEASLYFRLAEGELTDPRDAPRPPKALREYITNVALSRERLEQIMKKYNRSTPYLARNRIAAIDDFREDIEIDIARNYFIYERQPNEPPRSAQVTISFWGSDAEKTRTLLHDIGQVILRQQNDYRREHLAHTRQLLGAQLTLARERARALQEHIDRLWVDVAGAEDRGAIATRSQIAALTAELQGAMERVFALERRVGDIEFSAAAESGQLGLSFELFDEKVVTHARRLTPLQLAARGAVVFAMALLLIVPIVGAFDDRIYAPEDLAAHGLPLFGAVPQFPGDDAGSCRARTAGEGA